MKKLAQRIAQNVNNVQNSIDSGATVFWRRQKVRHVVMNPETNKIVVSYNSKDGVSIETEVVLHSTFNNYLQVLN